MAIPMQDIPQDHWQPYFTDFANQHAGWAVTIEVLDRELGDQPAARGIPLQGISYEYKGGSMAGDVLIEAGDAGTPFEVHRVHRPRRIARIAATEPGNEEDIQIESEDG